MDRKKVENEDSAGRKKSRKLVKKVLFFFFRAEKKIKSPFSPKRKF